MMPTSRSGRMDLRRDEPSHAKQDCSGLGGIRCVASSVKMSSLSLFSEAHAEAARQYRHEARLTCRSICTDYCNKTAVHGFRYFFDSRLSVAERIFWVFAVFLSIGGCFYLISKIWIKWDISPVIVTFSETPSPIWSVPFPAVTICPSTKTKKKLLDFTLVQQRILDKNATEEELWRYKALTMICNTTFSHENPLYNESAVDFLREVAPSFDDVFVECFWRYKKLDNCSHYFQTVETGEGICFTFNALGAQERYRAETAQAARGSPSLLSSGWSYETGYSQSDPTVKRYFPFRVGITGPYSGLRVVLRSDDRDLDYVCRGCEQGFRVILHNPVLASDASNHHLVLPLNSSMNVVARPFQVETTDGLRDYNPERRNCFFPSERHLRFYQFYSQPDCIFECYANVTLRRCGCAPFFWPRLPGNPVCGGLESRCLVNTFEHYVNDSQAGTPYNGPYPLECNCLPSCQWMHYDSEANVADYPWIMEKLARREPIRETKISMSQLNVYFDSLQFIRICRSEMYGTTEFLASSGGLLGLFSGFSVISLAEVLYYLSLRLWCEIRRRRGRQT